MPEPTSQRPLGLGSALWQLLGTTPSGGETPSAPAAPRRSPLVPDGFRRGPSFNNGRFNGLGDLAQLMTGGVIRPGAATPGVAAVQQALMDMGFVIADGATGTYGPQTTAAISNFQRMAGLSADGTLGPMTMRALDRLAPPPGKRAWDPGVNPGPVPDPEVAPGKLARVVVSVSQHRAFLYDATGNLVKIYGVRTGTSNWADGRGSETTAGVRVVSGMNRDPRSVSQALWPESNGKAFGTRLIDLTRIDPTTGRTIPGEGNGQELHGTYQENTIGFDASHGCVGLRNKDIEEIFAKLRPGDFVRFDA